MKKKVKKAGIFGMLPFIVMGGMIAMFTQVGVLKWNKGPTGIIPDIDVSAFRNMFK